MVKIALQISANVENITGLQPDGEDFQWYFKFKCANCGEVPDHWQTVIQTESHPLKGGRGSANCAIKCKLCGRENSCDIVHDTLKPYDFQDTNKFKSIVVFDCRGMEPIDFAPNDGWMCKGFAEEEDGDGNETGTVFEEVDLTDKEWADYDEKSGKSVSIGEFRHQFVKIK